MSFWNEKDATEMRSREVCHEFYSTYEFDEVCADDELKTKKIIKFRLGGRAYSLTLLEFAHRLGLYHAGELDEEGFYVYFQGGSIAECTESFYSYTPRVLMQDLYDKMGSMEIRQEAIKMIAYRSFSSFITINKGKSSLVFTFFSLPARAELSFKAETFLLTFAGADDGSFKVTPFKVADFNVKLDFKIDLIVFGPDIRSAPSSFFSGGSRMLQTEDSSAESYLVFKEFVTIDEGSVTFI
nr:hypothetical protein [Tanacetum cinerariifolium]